MSSRNRSGSGSGSGSGGGSLSGKKSGGGGGAASDKGGSGSGSGSGKRRRSRSPSRSRSRRSRSPRRSRSRSPARRRRSRSREKTRKPRKQYPPAEMLDRAEVCPFLLRVFIREHNHYNAAVFDRMDERELDLNEVQIYTWHDATLRELSDLVKSVEESATRPDSRVAFGIVSPNLRQRGKWQKRDVGTVHCSETRDVDTRTLGQLKFDIGDYLSVAILDQNSRQGGARNGPYGGRGGGGWRGRNGGGGGWRGRGGGGGGWRGDRRY